MFWMTSFAVHTVMAEIVSSNEVGCLEAQHDVGEVDDEEQGHQFCSSWTGVNFFYAGGDLTGRHCGGLEATGDKV